MSTVTLSSDIIKNVRENIHNFVWFKLTKEHRFKKVFTNFEVNQTVLTLCKAEALLEPHQKAVLKVHVDELIESGEIQDLFPVIKEELRAKTLTLSKITAVLYLVTTVLKHFIRENELSKVESTINFIRLQLDYRLKENNSEEDQSNAERDRNIMTNLLVAGIGLSLGYNIHQVFHLLCK